MQDGADIALIHLEFLGDKKNPSLSTGLFAFLYGHTLLAVSDSSQLEEGFCELTIDPILLKITPPPTPNSKNSDSEDGAEEEIRWDPVPMRWVAYNSSKEIINFSEDIQFYYK